VESRQALRCYITIAFFLLSTAAAAAVPDSELKTAYVGKVLTLRQFDSAPQLRFDAAGKLIGKSSPEAWTVAGQLRVQDISLQQGVLHVRGQRLFLFYDSHTKSLREVGSVNNGDTARRRFLHKLPQWYAKASKVEIQIECGELQTQDDASKAMNSVFLPPDALLTDVVPAAWRSWLNRTSGESAQNLGNSTGLYRAGDGVSPPKLKYPQDPTYPEIARQARYQATTVLMLVVEANGSPRDIQIVRPAGMGLDERAVWAVQQWKFDPAKKDGQPVPVQMSVEVNFGLF